MKTIIFDFDGVLVSNSKYLESFLTKILPFGNPKRSRDVIINAAKINKKNKFIAKYLRGVGSKMYLKFLKSKSSDSEFRSNLDVQEDILDLLPTLNSKSILLTSNYSVICKYILQEKSSYFDKLISFSEVNSKSEGIERLIEAKDIDVNNCLFITDTTGDLNEFKKYIPEDNIFAVSWGFHSKGELEKSIDKQNIFDDPKKLIEFLKAFDNDGNI